MTRWPLPLSLLVAVMSMFGVWPRAQADGKPLTAADRKLLDGLIQQFLFDPQGAEFVRVKTLRHWGNTRVSEVERLGWLRPGKDGQPARVYFTDGENILAPEPDKITRIDFVACCRRRYAAAAGPREDVANPPPVPAVVDPLGGYPDLAVAAWLHRFGEKELVGRAFGRAMNLKETVARLRSDLASLAYDNLVDAFRDRDDVTALTHGERLLRLYPEEAKKLPHAAPVVADLKRRQASGTFGRRPVQGLPIDFISWSARRRAEYLVAPLDETDMYISNDFLIGRGLYDDWRIRALMDLGDPAVPPLIDVIEKDNRMTRSTIAGRRRQNVDVLSVRAVASTIVKSILRVSILDPVVKGDNLRAEPWHSGEPNPAHLRAYWKEYGGITFEARMMKVLTNPRSQVEALREAARNLADPETPRMPGWQRVFRIQYRLAKANPAVARFRNPTAAEAILAAMDRDLLAHDAAERDPNADDDRAQIEDGYLLPLTDVNDRRIAPELARRAQTAPTIRMRRKYAFAAHRLGDPKPLAAYAEDFEKSQVLLPINDHPKADARNQPGYAELEGIVSYLSEAHTAECDRALHALADARHTYHGWAASRIREERLGWVFDREYSWFAHPYCIAFLGGQLDDQTPTGTFYRIDGNTLEAQSGVTSSISGLPDYLKDTSGRFDRAGECIRDAASLKLATLVHGLPAYHPLLKDCDARRQTIKAVLKRFRGRFRSLTTREAESLGHRPYGPTAFIPDLPPLGRAATADDVQGGRALFHLNGEGRPVKLALPAVAVLKRDEQNPQPPKVLIVQAEAGRTGEVMYGIIGAGTIGPVPASEVVKVTPVTEKAP
jgi:hypothetical protein